MVALDWNPAIRIGVLNCADEENTAICKDYGVQFYPTFRFFSPFTKDFTQGENYKAEADREVQTVRHVIIDYLESLPAEHRPPACPSLQPISSSDVTSLLTQKDPRYTAIIFESETSYIGREVILDLMQFEHITVRRTLDSDKAMLKRLGVVAVPSCYLIYPNASHGLINMEHPDKRFTAQKATEAKYPFSKDLMKECRITPRIQNNPILVRRFIGQKPF
ncbi:unnamed protein product [Ranitomeya imitator]|uniref:Sulfhydryl oxidase Trx-like domain-containing protein n=1 Tax=Ranitomeya imitator TaxID=111125 RepID=A0ABN9MIV3_9NEOB|nr:unnamed protein product [Ranitomeya imitator]